MNTEQGQRLQVDRRDLPVTEHAVISSGFFFAFAAIGMVSLLPLVLSQRGVPDSQIGFLSAIFAIAGIVSQLAAGRLSDRLEKRKPFVIFPALGAAAAAVGFLIGSGFWQYALIYAVCGAGFHTLNSCLTAMTSDWARVTGATDRVFGRVRLWGSVGFILSLAVLSRWLEDDRLVLGAMALFFVLAALSALPAREPREHIDTSLEIKGDVRRLLTDSRLLAFMICLFLYKVGESCYHAYLGVFMLSLDASRAAVGWAMVIGAVSEVPLMFAAGTLAMRFGRRNLMLTAFTVLAFRLMVTSSLPTWEWVLLLQALHGFSFGLMSVCAVAHLAERAPGNLSATAQGLLGMTLALGMAAGPALGGLVVGTAEIETLFLLLAGVVVTGGILFVLVIRNGSD